MNDLRDATDLREDKRRGGKDGCYAQHEECQVGFNGEADNESGKEGGCQLEEDAELVTNSILHFNQVTV